MTMSGERDNLPPPFDGFEPLPLEMEPLDRRLRHDATAWLAQVPETRQLDALAHTLATTMTVEKPEMEVPPRPDVPSGTLPEVSAVRLVPFRRRNRTQNVLSIVAMVAIVSLLAVVLLNVGRRGPTVASKATATIGVPPTATQPLIPSPSATTPSAPTTTPAPFTVTRVDLSVNPTSIAGTRCGTFLTVTYTATFHLASGGPGGTIQFQYTVNNGRGSTMASITAAHNQTAVSYSFSWSGNLPADHTYPEPGGVIVRSPDAVSSPLLGPSGKCS